MKQYKIVKYFDGFDDFMFRVYERKNLLFWKPRSSFVDIESAERNINWLKACKIEEKARKVTKTPKPETIAYL